MTPSGPGSQSVTGAAAWAKLLLSPITSVRMDLVWRLFGLALVLLWIQHMDADSVFVFFEASAASLDWFALAGLVLLVAGPSLLALLGGAITGTWFLLAVIDQTPTLEFVADEYLIQAGVPVVAAFVSILHVGRAFRRRGADFRVDRQLRDELDDLNARIFRIVVVTTIGFAGLHKLNSDFFDEGSCALLGHRLGAWWELPFELPIAGPVSVVVLELLAAAMLLVFPRLGILLVVYVMAGLGHVGPVAFATLCVVMSLAFLDRGDIPMLRSFVARRWGVLLAVALATTVVSFSTYTNQLPWLKYGLMEAVLISVATLVLVVGVTRLRRGPGLPRRLVPAAIRWWRRPPTVMPGLSSWLALILIVNGMTPYLGVKYRFSVAMLSNLRVDQERWNSLVIPEWVRLREHTPHITVEWHPVGKWAPASARRGQSYLDNGLFTGASLADALQFATTRGVRGQLDLTYRGETTRFELPRDMLGARTFAQQRTASVFWQEQLGPGDAPQTCVH